MLILIFYMAVTSNLCLGSNTWPRDYESGTVESPLRYCGEGLSHIDEGLPPPDDKYIEALTNNFTYRPYHENKGYSWWDLCRIISTHDYIHQTAEDAEIERICKDIVAIDESVPSAGIKWDVIWANTDKYYRAAKWYVCKRILGCESTYLKESEEMCASIFGTENECSKLFGHDVILSASEQFWVSVTEDRCRKIVAEHVAEIDVTPPPEDVTPPTEGDLCRIIYTHDDVPQTAEDAKIEKICRAIEASGNRPTSGVLYNKLIEALTIYVCRRILGYESKHLIDGEYLCASVLWKDDNRCSLLLGHDVPQSIEEQILVEDTKSFCGHWSN